MKIETIQDCYNLIENEETRQKLKLALMSSFVIYFKFMFLVMNGRKATIKPFMELIFGKLEDIVYQRNTKPNLLLNLSIGSGKSTIIQYFITWCFARDINNTFIYTSANDSLITRLSADTKYIIENEFFEKIFESKLKKSERAKINYSFENAIPRTGLIAKTLRGALTGLDVGSLDSSRFTGALLIDDPLDAGDIRSEIKKEECINIYKDKLSTRKRNFSVPTILVMQRLCTDDLSGYILEHETEDWDSVIIPALDDKDRPIGIIDESMNSLETILKIRNTNEFKFYSQYQQKPIVDGGALFKIDSFCFTDDIPKKFDWRFITADIAYKEKEQNDFTAFSYWGVINIEGRNRLYWVDLVIRHINAVDIENWIEPWIKNKISYGFRQVWIEDKGHGIFLNQSFRKKGYHIPSEEEIKETLPRHTDKVERANNILSCIDGIWQNVYINNRIDCLPQLKKELLEFPNSKHDDIIDTLIDAVKIALFEEDIVEKYKRLYG